MLTQLLMDAGRHLLGAILSVMDVLPGMPQTVRSAIQNFFNLIFDNIGILGFFVPINFCVTFVGMAIAVENFEHIYSFIMWVLRKIPFTGIE